VYLLGSSLSNIHLYDERTGAFRTVLEKFILEVFFVSQTFI